MPTAKYDDEFPLGEGARNGLRITWRVHDGSAPAFDRTDLQSIGEVAKRFGLTLRALRFYESKGLVRPLRDGMARYYGAKDLVRIALILKGKQLGFTLSEIVAMLNDGRSEASTDLVLSREQLLAQIGHLEHQQRINDQALVELRRRYYLMADMAEAH